MSPDLYELIKSGYDPKLEPTGEIPKSWPRWGLTVFIIWFTVGAPIFMFIVLWILDGTG